MRTEFLCFSSSFERQRVEMFYEIYTLALCRLLYYKQEHQKRYIQVMSNLHKSKQCDLIAMFNDTSWYSPSTTLNSRNIFLIYTQRNFSWTREKGRDLTQSYDKSPYTNRNVKRAKWQHKQRHKKVRLNSACGPKQTKQILQTKKLLSLILIEKLLAVMFIPAFTKNAMNLDYLSSISPWLSGDVPIFPLCGVYISQFVRFSRCCTSVLDWDLLCQMMHSWKFITV